MASALGWIRWDTFEHVIDPQAWEQLKQRVLDTCRADRSSDAVALLREATGLDWCDPGEPGRFPPTPATRDLDDVRARLSRHLRRTLDRALGSEDACGAYEVLGVVYDAQIEAELTGESQLLDYLEYLATVPYGCAVYEFIRQLHSWLLGLIDDHDYNMAVVVSAAVLVALACAENAKPAFVQDARERPPPLVMLPRRMPHGPPVLTGVDRQLS